MDTTSNLWVDQCATPEREFICIEGLSYTKDELEGPDVNRDPHSEPGGPAKTKETLTVADSTPIEEEGRKRSMSLCLEKTATW